MDSGEKLAVLGSAALFDVCTGSCGGPARPRNAPPAGIGASVIYPAALPDGRTVSLFKVLQTNACRHNCLYCANRADRGVRRTQFQPEELAALFMDFHRRGYVQGLFLSSAVAGSPERTMADMLTTAEIVRRRYGFAGYLHLKVLPGAPYDCVERAVELADRVSVNMEAPTEAQLTRIAPDKHMPGDVVQRMHWIKRAASRAGLMTAGQSTQFVVGAGRETDRELLTSVTALYRDVGLRRAYFSAFEPIADTPLAEQQPAPPMREHRLYQADWLLRRYSGVYALGDIVFEDDGDLALDMDPKLAIALRQRAHFPIEINRADYAELLRVPGIGPKSARRIVVQRRVHRFGDVAELRRVGVAVRRAAPFVLINGRAQGDAEALARREQTKSPGDRQLVLPVGGLPFSTM
jgi:putative DNA modification/repair radical SAM protein